jgi:serine/threonine-protein kinase
VEPVGVGEPHGVWRAVDRAGDEVAVKALRPYPVGDVVSEGRFRLVARTVREVAGPGIARVRTFGEAVQPDGMAVPYVVRDLIGGQTLEQRLGMAPLAAHDALRIVASVAAALAVAHQAGVPHGHIVPSNIMLGAGTVTVTDFGLRALRPLPAEDATAGGLSYVAPELAGHGPATPAADMYALGVIFVACLAGISWRTQLPAGQDTEPAPLGDLGLEELPAGLASMWAACLGPNPADRPAAAHAAALSWRLLGHDPVASAWPAEAQPDAEPGQPPAAAGSGQAPGGRRPPAVSVEGARSARRPAARGWLGSAGPLPGAAAYCIVAVALGIALAVLAIPAYWLVTGQLPALSSPGTSPAPATAPASPAPELSSPAPVVLSSRAALNRVSATIRADVADGQMRQDVGVDLDNLIGPVQARLAVGEPAPVRKLAAALRAKLAARVSEGALTAQAARVLAGELDALARSPGS